MLSFKYYVADRATGSSTVLTAAGACSKLQRLTVKTSERRFGLGMRRLPDSLAKLESLAGLDLQYCGLEGALQLPTSLVHLRLDDRTPYKLPANLGAMTALTRLAANSAVAPPPAWPPRLQDLRVHRLYTCVSCHAIECMMTDTSR